MDLLRFFTAGNVDDGKSTLIGRLLYDSDSLFEDQLALIEKQRIGDNKEDINFSLLTDGLKAEREQGITIDVAYRYFSTEKRKFIIGDAPGHVQYTRNMITAASTANLIILLIDARLGLTEQTKRHAFISSLLEIPHAIVCINKMDLEGYSEERYLSIRDDFVQFSEGLHFKTIDYLPISALKGDNVVNHSKNMPWYEKQTLMEHINHIDIEHDYSPFGRFPVQYVLRPQSDEHHDFRAYAGMIKSGEFYVGQKVKVFPINKESEITAIHQADKEIDKAIAPMSVALSLKDDIDLSRGGMIIDAEHSLNITNEFSAQVCIMDENPLVEGKKYLLKHGSNTTKAIIKNIIHKIDIHTLTPEEQYQELSLNEIGKIVIKTSQKIFADLYSDNRYNGNFILIDEATNNTVAAGMIC